MKKGWVIGLGSIGLGMIALLLAGCQGEPPKETRVRHPWIVIGIDGGEWDVIRDLWSQGRPRRVRPGP